MEPFVLFVVVIQATINQFATPIRDLPINHADRSHLRSESSQSTDQSANSHSFISMAECQVYQSRHVGSDSGNDCHNPVAEFDVDVSNDAISDLGSWLGSPRFPAANQCWEADSLHRLFYHEGHEEHEGNQSTKRLMPSFSLVTLKFISSPIFISANFI